MKHTETTSKLWIYKPSILWDTEHINFIPKHTMNTTEKLNALTRTMIVLGLIGLIIQPSARLFIIIIMSVSVLGGMMYITTKNDKEGFRVPYQTINNHTNIQQQYTKPTPNNPLMNVLQKDYYTNPDRKPATPSFTPSVREEINHNVEKKFDYKKNDLSDTLQFEHSMRQFHSMPNTTIPNDQDAFLKFCYGNMGSCRGGDQWKCEQNNYRHILR